MEPGLEPRSGSRAHVPEHGSVHLGVFSGLFSVPFPSPHILTPPGDVYQPGSPENQDQWCVPAHTHTCACEKRVTMQNWPTCLWGTGSCGYGDNNPQDPQLASWRADDAAPVQMPARSRPRKSCYFKSKGEKKNQYPSLTDRLPLI